VRVVIADTGPVHYLLLIGHIHIQAALFENVILPSAVQDELTDPGTPLSVRNWIAHPPAWMEIRHPSQLLPGLLSRDLGAGETAALALAAELNADLVLLDDRQAVSVAHEMGITITGTLGLLARASRLGLLDLAESFDRLKRTNFRYKQDIMDKFLAERERTA
jgi:predicted nucleic acid-binding protein